MMGQEGIEEVISEYATTGMEAYAGGDGSIKAPDNKEFYSKVMYAFLGGALASSGMALMQNIVIDTTINKDTEKFYKQFNKMVEQGQEQEAIDLLNKNIQTLVIYLKRLNRKVKF